MTVGLFGRGKRDTSGPVCATCGRTLLAGELTQRIVDDDGEQLVCSLCSQPSTGAGEAHIVAGVPVANDDGERSESDTFWRALKEKDAEVAHLEARLARSEAERQELAGQLALLQAQVEGAAALTEIDEAEIDEEVTPDPEEPCAGENTASMEALEEPVPAKPEEQEEGASEDTIVPVAGEVDEGISSLTLLQRGVDVLNVSPVPRKVADTSADLGVPQVHVGFDGQTVAVTFLWSLGWYRFSVDIEGAGAVRLNERGYDDRPELQPNASVRPDGTVQIAPAQISRAAREREQPQPAEDSAARDVPRTPRDAAERPPEIVSQSLLGQRTDDEQASWEETQSRDFHW